jgi:hypothetical protein
VNIFMDKYRVYFYMRMVVFTIEAISGMLLLIAVQFIISSVL